MAHNYLSQIGDPFKARRERQKENAENIKEWAEEGFQYSNGSITSTSGERGIDAYSRIADAIRVNKLMELTNGKIANALDNEIKHWCPRRSVFISAPTGSGKTSFVKNTLVKDCKERGEKVLLVTNRLALNRQLKKDIAEEYDKDKYQDILSHIHRGYLEGIDKIEEIADCVTIINYQRLTHIMKEHGNWGYKFKYAIFDEVHFFLEDALFNVYTEQCLEKIATNFKSTIRIYLSATMSEVLPIIYAKELEAHKECDDMGVYSPWNKECRKNKENCFSLNRFESETQSALMDTYLLKEAERNQKDANNYTRDGELYNPYNLLDINFCRYRAVLYVFDADYSVYQPAFFSFDEDENDYEELLSYVRKNTGKWFIYVTNKKIGNAIKTAINGTDNKSEDEKETKIEGHAEASEKTKDITSGLKGKKAIFISRDLINKKDTEVVACYNSILKDEKYSIDNKVNVLITTGVLDNGINLNDKEITNIAIMTTNRIEFLQALGRVRLVGQPRMNLYIAEYSEKNLKNQWFSVKRQLNEMRDLKDFINQRGLQYDDLPEHVYMKNVKPNIFEVRINSLAKHKLELEYQQLSNLLKVIEGKCTATTDQLQLEYREMVWSWLMHTESYKETVARENARMAALKAELNDLFDEQEKTNKYNSKEFENRLKEIFAKHGHTVAGKTPDREAGPNLLKAECKKLIGRTFITPNDGTVKIKPA